MVIGVVALPKNNTKALTLKRIFGYISVKRAVCPENPFELMLATLPFGEAQLRRKGMRKLKKFAGKARRKLAVSGAEKVIFSTALIDIFCEKGMYEYCVQQKKSRELLLKFAPLCIRETAAKIGINLFESRICISDSKMERISEYLINSLCFDVKNLAVITQNKQKAVEICEKFYDESGFLIDIRDRDTHQSDVLIDVDKGCIKFGSDLSVCGADMGYNFLGYDVNHLAAAEATGDSKSLPCCWNFDYKKYVDFIR